MAFTIENTLNEVLHGLNTEQMLRFFNLGISVEFINFVPEKMRNCSLAEIKKQITMPWGAPYPSEDVVKIANFSVDMVQNRKYGIIPLWQNEDGKFFPDMTQNNKNSVFLMTLHKEILSSTVTKRPVIICPGGGYETLSFIGEGTDMAEQFEAAGYYPFILSYRLNPNHYPEPQKDLALAIKYIKANAGKYGINPEKMVIMGSSAGGHLCASTALLHSEIEKELMEDLKKTNLNLAEKYKDIPIKPYQICLNYSVISFVKEYHEGSFLALTGGDEKLRDKLSIERHMTDDYPATFAWACEDDELVPVSNTKRLGAALSEKKIPHEIKIYPSGGHGCGLAKGTSAQGWFAEMLKFISEK